VVKGTVLTTLLTAYQQANDSPNMLKTAKRLLDADPTSLRAALVYVYLTKQQATAKAATDPAAALFRHHSRGFRQAEDRHYSDFPERHRDRRRRQEGLQGRD
jgi:hypothetical protein